MSTFTSKHRFTTADYGQMVLAGILSKDDRVELLDGEIIDMPPIGPGHNSGVTYLNTLFSPLAPKDALVQVQGPIELDQVSEPEPDLVLLRPRKDFYRHKLPGPKDVLLLIEVADSSLLLDRDRKVRLYARAGIVEMWLADLVSREVVVHRRPRGERYADVTRHHPGEKVSSLAFPKLFLDVKELFG